MSDDTGRMLDEISRGTRRGKTRKKKPEGRSGHLVWLLLPVLLAVTWLVYEQRGMQGRLSNLANENDRLGGELQALESTLADTETRVITALEEAELQRDTDTALVMEQLEARLSNLDAVLDEQALDVRWLYAEVNYLLRLADRKLQLERDVGSALVLLDTADQLLQRADSSSADDLRRHIAGIRQSLRAIELPDISGWSYRLAALIQAVPDFSILESRRGAYRESLESARESVSVQSSADGAEQDLLTTALGWMRTSFVLRSWDEPPDLLLPAEQESLLKQNLQLLLEQARLALMMGDKVLMQTNLQQARQWLIRNYQGDSSPVRSALAELDALSQITLQPDLPDLGVARALAQQLAGGEGR